MGKKANPAVIGGFVVGGVALLVAAILLVAGGGFLTERPKYALFFDGSVKGLRVGAAVTFRGVAVGRVIEVQMLYDVSNLSLKIPVIIELFPERLTVVGERKGGGEVEGMPQLVERGLKAQLQLESLVTSQLFVNLDFYPDEPVHLLGVDMGVPELPTVPSGLQRITRTVESLPIEEIAAKLVNTLDAVEKLVNAPELIDSVVQLNAGMKDFRELMDSPGLKDTITGINETLGDLRTLLRNSDTRLATFIETAEGTMNRADTLLEEAGSLVKNVDARVEPLAGEAAEAARSIAGLSETLGSEVTTLSAELRRLAARVGTAVEEVSGTVVEIREIVDEDSIMRTDFVTALEEMRGAARALRILAETLEQRPDALFRGKRPLGGGP
jgi:paraquat-inducible protein B